MPTTWNIRLRLAKPACWLVLVMLCNSFIAVDTHRLEARWDGRSDDLDTLTEWVYETMTDESMWWTEESPGEEEDHSTSAAKWYKWLAGPQAGHACMLYASQLPVAYQWPQDDTAVADGFVGVLQPPPNTFMALS